jgi:hypothetical protein
MCEDLKLQEFALATEGNLNCWIYAFEEFVTKPLTDPSPAETAEI